jgi:hypothetical protein
MKKGNAVVISHTCPGWPLINTIEIGRTGNERCDRQVEGQPTPRRVRGNAGVSRCTGQIPSTDNLIFERNLLETIA